MTEKIFAFGSNMCSGRFRAYNVNPIGVGTPALLKDYRLCFNKFSTEDGSGKANVERSESGEQVLGVLYEISKADKDVLDRGEGGYTSQPLLVEIPDGESCEAWVYIATKPRTDMELRPYTWYKRFLVEGAREHKLPSEYIEFLESLEVHSDPDKDRERRKLELSCTS